MKYRIKKTTFNRGRVKYKSYVKKGFFWFGLCSDGSVGLGGTAEGSSREYALSIIDKHLDVGTKAFEYITR